MMQLDSAQLRVLGSLMEKEVTTPENYPLSLNALVNACNQRSSRDPVMDLDEGQVRDALEVLESLDLVRSVRDARVAKFENTARTVLNLRRDEAAAICLLVLRGPQTAGELRSRSDRMYGFEDLAAAQATLERLAGRAAAEDGAGGPLVVLMARQPGSREARFAHLLGGVPEAADVYQPARVGATAATEPLAERVLALEAEVAELRERLDRLEGR